MARRRRPVSGVLGPFRSVTAPPPAELAIDLPALERDAQDLLRRQRDLRRAVRQLLAAGRRVTVAGEFSLRVTEG